jgi:hypothetical protein
MVSITRARELQSLLARRGRQREDSYECDKCIKLEVSKLFKRLQQAKGHKRQECISIIVIQWLIVGKSDYGVSTCNSCQSCERLVLELNRTATTPTLLASKIWFRGGLVSGFRQHKTSGCFVVRDGWLAPCTDLEGSDPVSKDVSAGSKTAPGDIQHCERNQFGILSFPWSYVGMSEENHVYRVSDRPNYFSIVQWLHDCTDRHPDCRPRPSLNLHSITLIDVNARRLVQYPQTIDGDCDYIALSYVWGNSIQHSLQRSDSLPKRLPRTIEDALAVVKKLGKKYLWVDSICIDQSSAAEKMSQISIMDQIYQGAFATLIALSGKSADSGIPGVQRQPKRKPQMYAKFGEIKMASRMPTLEEELDRSTWMERAWTYQEAVLSQRCIIFTEHQVFFSCNEMECSEVKGRSRGSRYQIAGDLLTPDSKLHPLKDPLIHFEIWNRLNLWDWSIQGYPRLKIYNSFIGNYTRRNMTKDSDSLNAITALLKRMQGTIFPKGFLYGLPIEMFRHALLWSQNFNGGQRSARRRTEGNFPSWSWVAWQFEAGIQTPKHPEDMARGRLQPPLGAISRACVRGPINWEHAQLPSQWDLPSPPPEVKQAVTRIRDLFSPFQDRAKDIKLNPSLLFQKKVRMEELYVEGFLLRLPTTLTLVEEPSHRGTQYRLNGVPVAPKLYLPEDLCQGPDHPPFAADWHLECECGDIALDKIIFHNFLLISVIMTNKEDIRMDLILISWEGDVAVRKAVVTISWKWRGFGTFWAKAEPRMSRFRFG